jgi:hypothetical protein
MHQININIDSCLECQLIDIQEPLLYVVVLGKSLKFCHFLFCSLILVQDQVVSAIVPPVLWICIGFNADPDQDFYLSADPVPDPGSQASADSYGSGSGFN